MDKWNCSDKKQLETLNFKVEHTTACQRAARFGMCLNCAYETVTRPYGALPPLFVCFWRNSPQRGQGLLIQEVSRSHSTTHHSR